MNKVLLSGILLTLITMGTITAADAAANVVVTGVTVYEKTDFTGLQKTGQIEAFVQLKNIGDAVSPPFIYEIQPRPYAFSFVQPSDQKVCLPSNSFNVHRDIPAMLPGDNTQFYLTTPQLTKGIYSVYGISFNNCCWSQGNPVSCAPSQPYAADQPVSGNHKITDISVVGGLSGTPVCGDGHCVSPETAKTCINDCPSQCGDGFCTGSETHASCAPDCAATPTPPPPANNCGNSVCDSGENQTSCPADCTVPLPDVNLFGYLLPISIVILACGAIWIIWRKK